MSTDIWNTMILAFAFLVLFGIAELLYHFFKVSVNYTRKLVHIGTGILALLFPIMLGNHWLVLLLCTSFAIILFVSLYFRLLPSINAIERKSVGSLAYPLSVYLCYLAYDYLDGQYIYFYLPIIILAISDPLAAFFGRRFQWGKYSIGSESKTLIGSLVFMVSAIILVITFAINTNYGKHFYQVFLTAFLIGILSSLVEAVSKKGWDNLTIPISVLAGLIFCSYLFGI